ncbi:MAG: lysoplasmalogenase [Caldisericia bacterium]|nr:lysoplasmalogenase [Caldisericia bacterium]
MKIIFLLLYFLFLIIDLIFIHFKLYNKRFFSKTLLMPILILYYVFSSQNVLFLLIVALFMSFLGDVLLLFEERKIFFKLGLFSFLLSHIFYILTFLITSNFFKENTPSYIFIFLIPYILYGTYFYKFLFPEIEEFKKEILIYIIVIILMSFITIPRIYIFPLKSSLLVFIGSILFILSDSTLALQIFKGKISKNSIIIMITYGLAQFLIIQGFIY